MTTGDIGAALYANCFRIGHNSNEFMIEAGQAYEDGERFIVMCRLVVTPRTARELHQLLGESLSGHARLNDRDMGEGEPSRWPDSRE